MSESNGEVFILGGTGNVGSELARQILARPDNGLVLGGIVNSGGYYVFESPDSIRANLLAALSAGREAFRESVQEHGSRIRGSEKIPEDLFGCLDEGTIVIDATSLDEEVLGLYNGFAEGKGAEFRDGGLITVNKKPLVICSPEVFRTLASLRRHFGFAGTVMAGTGACIDEVLTLNKTTEGVSGIEGCLSGTLGYLCGAMEENSLDFSVILTHARDQGFTEPDPRVDLGGWDVARKLVILARAAGYDVNLPDVDVNSFIPKEFLDTDCDVSEYMRKIQGDRRLNMEMRRIFDTARRDSKRLRYIAEMKVNGRGEKPTLRVGLKSVKSDYPLANLDGTGNRVLIHTKDFPGGPRVSIGGPGAGPAVTAQAVLRDICRMLGV